METTSDGISLGWSSTSKELESMHQVHLLLPYDRLILETVRKGREKSHLVWTSLLGWGLVFQVLENPAKMDSPSPQPSPPHHFPDESLPEKEIIWKWSRITLRRLYRLPACTVKSCRMLGQSLLYHLHTSSTANH